MILRGLAPFRVTPRPSRIGLALVLLAGFMALAGVLRADVPGWLSLLLVPALWLPLRRLGWLGGRLEVVDIDAQGGLACAGEPVRVLADSVATPWLIVLRLERRQGRSSLVLLPDSAPVDTLRQLRVLLRWHVSPRLISQHDSQNSDAS